MPMGSHSLEIGKEAPALTLSSHSRLNDLSDLDGKYVVINFWNPNDPVSRINNRRLSDITSNLNSSKVKFVSICTGENDVLANEIMKVDNVSDKTISLSAKDFTPQITEDFQINTGNRSFMIDPFGNLVSISPTEEFINSILS